MNFIALKELPQGQQPGEVFDTTEAMGDVLVSVGAAKRVEEEEESSPPVAPARRRYQRRDMEAAEG
jgi:hypothetical protein